MSATDFTPAFGYYYDMQSPLISHDYLVGHEGVLRNERKTLLVVVLTTTMMVVELITGYLTSSMALFADGWHMASHSGALLITVIAYRMARAPQVSARFTFGGGKFIPLGGYTSAVILAIVALLMAAESMERLFSPRAIHYDDALLVTAIGLVVNLASAYVLGSGNNLFASASHGHSHAHAHHHGHTHTHGHAHHVPVSSADSNLRSAFFHVLADALTSVLALAALYLGKTWEMPWVDAAVGLLGSVIILRWAYRLCVDAGLDLLDAHAEGVDPEAVRKILAEKAPEATLLDIHVWRIAPQILSCELVVQARQLRGSDFYRNLLADHFEIGHLVIEERLPRIALGASGH